MKKIKTAISRQLHGLAALLVLGAAVAPAFMQTAASATGQVTARSIQLSTSAASTVSQYKITITPVTTSQELVVDFCSDTPFPGATCAFAASSVPTVGSPTSSVGTAAAITNGTPTHAFKVTGLTMTGGSPFTVTITAGITNPTTANATFYARVLTYATGNATGYAPASSTGGATTTGTFVDSGGIALSTASTIAITAQVMESLSFCVYLGSGSCGTAPTFFLGHSTNNILDTTAVDTKTVKFDLSTNAVSGCIIRLTGDTLTSGSNTIAAAGSSPATITAGTAAFGLYVSAAGGLTLAANYNGGSGSQYGLNTTNTTSTFGDQVANSASTVNSATSTITYGATASTTTPAGIYTANHQLIATGTF
jgi:hypothetical protein